MKKVCVFLFSGTGMTRYVVERLTSELEKLQVQVDIYPIEKTQIQSITLRDYDAVSVAYPVHAFNAPKIVINFARQLPTAANLNTFIISTAGERHPVNKASSRLLMRILNKKGYHVFYDKQFIMPSNFAIKFDEAQVNELIDTVKAEIPQAAHDITSLTNSRQKPALFSRFIAVVGRAEWLGARAIGKHFYTDESCSHCGLCVDCCPNHNIKSSQKRNIHFKWHCGLCMRCVYICPQRAIKVHQPFKFISLSEWYKNEELLAARRKQPPHCR